MDQYVWWEESSSYPEAIRACFIVGTQSSHKYGPILLDDWASLNCYNIIKYGYRYVINFYFLFNGNVLSLVDLNKYKVIITLFLWLHKGRLSNHSLFFILVRQTPLHLMLKEKRSPITALAALTLPAYKMSFHASFEIPQIKRERERTCEL